MVEPIRLDALGPGGEYRARQHLTVPDVAGTPFVDMGVVPTLYVTRTMTALRRARPASVAGRIAAIGRAGELFATATLGGLSTAEYEHAVSRVSGIPIAVVRAATVTTARRATNVARTVRAARPTDAVDDWRDPRTNTGCAVWARRGEVFAVHISGVHPGAHGLWPEALALGYRVAVRPSRREPLTPHRLVAALRAAGFGDDQVVLLPTEHEAAEALLRCADLAYGGDETIRQHPGDPTILAQEPGRSKILLTADVDWHDHLDTIVDSVIHHGGASCVNTTAVFVDGDPAPLAEAVAERLATLPSLPPEDDKAILPVQSVASARALAKFLRDKADGTTAWLGADGVVDDLGDGSAALRPAVHQVDRSDAAQIGVELPFPCVWIAPWSAADGVRPLRDTLTLTVITRDEGLVDSLFAEPSISNLHIGDHPTYWTDIAMPHDGYLSDFLMRTKAVIRD